MVNKYDLGLASSFLISPQIYARDGADLIIMGNVQSGAEVRTFEFSFRFSNSVCRSRSYVRVYVGTGRCNIHIYGALRGRALAGISGNATAKIFSAKFQAELVSWV